MLCFFPVPVDIIIYANWCLSRFDICIIGNKIVYSKTSKKILNVASRTLILKGHFPSSRVYSSVGSVEHRAKYAKHSMYKSPHGFYPHNCSPLFIIEFETSRYFKANMNEVSIG